MDSVYLRRGHGMVDLMYFERPREILEIGTPFFLTIHPERWEIPIRHPAHHRVNSGRGFSPLADSGSM